MDSHESYYERNENRKCPLYTMVKLLVNLPSKLPILLEVQFLKKFSESEDAPLLLFKPRTLIEDMMKIHAEWTASILKHPERLTKFIYKYNSGVKQEEFVFTNNMPFYVDIFVICFMKVVQLREAHIQIMSDLKTIMRKKYNIFTENISDPLTITERKIMVSYPSIIISLLNFLNKNTTGFISILLKMWNLTNIFYSPVLALIIPVIVSEYKTPLALLLVMAIALDNNNTPSYVLYQRILAFYNSKVFSRSFKLRLCVNLGIIYKKNQKYRFAPYFTTLREKAIHLIRMIRINRDTSVEYTLSKISK